MYEGAHGRWLSRSGCGSDALLDEIAIGRGPEADADPEERVEGRPHVPSSVPSEYELVQVSLNMTLAEAVECAFPPPFEVREDAVDPVHNLVRLLALNDTHLVGVFGRVLVAEPAVCDDVRPALDRPADKAVEGLRCTVRDVLHPDPAGMAVLRQLDRTDDEDLANRTSSALRPV